MSQSRRKFTAARQMQQVFTIWCSCARRNFAAEDSLTTYVIADRSIIEVAARNRIERKIEQYLRPVFYDQGAAAARSGSGGPYGIVQEPPERLERKRSRQRPDFSTCISRRGKAPTTQTAGGRLS